jgi:uncharacterized protein YjiS (DUF1127 family)
MAAIETNRLTVSGILFGGRLNIFAATLIGKFSAWNDARVTRNSLSKLTNRELDDIGLCRGDIQDIAG